MQVREFEQGNQGDTRQRLEGEAAQFGNTSQTMDTQQTSGEGAAATGEHVHHHVHEQVQPVINKETITPEVVHTTVPIHETHRAAAEHHGTSTLPTRTMDDFTSGGGSLQGSGTTAHETYEGDPRPYNPALQTERSDADANFQRHDGLHDHQSALGSSTGTSGPQSSNTANEADPRVDSNQGGGSGLGTAATGAGTGQGMTGTDTSGTGVGSETAAGQQGSDFGNRVDPRVDSDRDGSAGLPQVVKTGHGTGTGPRGGDTVDTGLGSETRPQPQDTHLDDQVHDTVDARSAPSGGHHGAGAAAGVGAAAAGVGAVEAEKHHDRDTGFTGDNTQDTSNTTGGTGSGLTGSHRDGQSGVSGSNAREGEFGNDPTSARQDEPHKPRTYVRTDN